MGKAEYNLTKDITLMKDKTIIRNVVSNFVDHYWFAPQDCLLRSIETLIWARRYFKPPVLDIGTGDGRMSRFMFYMNQVIDVGIDINKKAVQEANKHGNYGIYESILVCDATKMSFGNSSFNTVISNSTFEHIENEEKAVREVARVLKKGGLFFNTVPIPRHQRFLKDMGINSKEIKKYNDRVIHHRYRSVSEWKQLLKLNNLKMLYRKSYFPFEVQKMWYRFHKIATFKPYRRELWSYLKDSHYGSLFPAFLVKPIIKQIVFNNVEKAFKGQGAWLFYIARKV